MDDPSDGLNPEKVIKNAQKMHSKSDSSKDQKEIINELARRLGPSERETLRTALMDYAKELKLNMRNDA